MEIELKFQIPAESKAPLEKFIQSKGGTSKRLRAKYFDTDDRLLARSNIALRLRKEGHVWYQTLKVAPQAAAVIRHEDTVRLVTPPGTAPVLDTSRHSSSDQWTKIDKLLRHDAAHELKTLYETDLKRLSVDLRTRRGLINYAIDTGSILTTEKETDPLLTALGHRVEPLKLPVNEIELELVSGSNMALIEAGTRLVRDYGVWLDVRTKSMRGDSLAKATLIMAPAKAQSVKITDDLSLEEFFEIVRKECVRHALVNASQLASEEGYSPEHIHQLRIALRRLRTALKLFSRVHNFEVQTWSDQAKFLAAQLGKNRDIDAMSESIWPELHKINAPLVEFSAQEGIQSPALIVREGKIQSWFLELIGRDLQSREQNTQSHWSAIMPIIIKWQKKCAKRAKNFASLTVEERHELRKKMKRLRYSLEFIEGECKNAKFRHFSKVLARAQNELGTYNDLQVALENYRAIVTHDPAAWFAVGWLIAQLSDCEVRCIKVLSDFTETDVPWRKAVISNQPNLLSAANSDG
jgi:inorganic triphosphatase YgiF